VWSAASEPGGRSVGQPASVSAEINDAAVATHVQQQQQQQAQLEHTRR